MTCIEGSAFIFYKDLVFQTTTTKSFSPKDLVFQSVWEITFQQELQVGGQAQYDTCSNKHSVHLFLAPEYHGKVAGLYTMLYSLMFNPLKFIKTYLISIR
jgi:hypothetical protein